jgi:ATP-binding cassette subfamily F protein 3
MRKKVADILSDQDLYSVEKLKDLENWNKKFSEIDEAINRAEKLWIQAQQNFEKIKLSANK